MPPSDGSTVVALTVVADPGTEIFVIDHSFTMVARGLGRLGADVPPGLYKIRYRAGALVEEQHVTIPAGPPVTLQAPRLAFASVAPLAGTSRIHEYHRDNAATLSRRVDRSVGDGGQLFVFARTWHEGRTAPVVPAGHHPATGLTLRDLSGELLVDYGESAHRDVGARDPWAGYNVGVTPGAFRLRVDTPRWGALEQIVVVPSGWQAQVFLFQFECGSDEPAFRPALAEASILLSRLGEGFDPASEALKLAELGRQALRDSRRAAPRALLTQMLNAKFDNPMLGIYAGHALIASEERDRALLRAVIQNVRDLVGPHPDLEALALTIDEAVIAAPMAIPPMLRSSWSTIVRRSQAQPSLVPAQSLAARVALAIWGDGPWLIWQTERADDPGLPLDDFTDAVLAYLSQARHAAGSVAAAAIGTMLRSVPGAVRRAIETPEASRDLARLLGVPPSTLQGMLGRLRDEVGRRLNR